MGDLDVVAIPGYKGMWARRVVVEAWIAAGRPRINWAGRTYEEQKRLYLGWKNKLPGYNAADNPDANTRQPHVRGMAFDLAVWDAGTVKRMLKAGFTRPITVRNGFSQDEPWHFELAAYVGKIRDIPKVTAAVAGGGAKPFEPAQEDDMTPEQATQLDAIYKALFGPNNGPHAAKAPLAWRNIDGDAQNVRYGILPIVIENQRREAVQAGKIAALTSLVQQLKSGGPVDMSAIEKAAEKGAREALSGLTLKAS